MLDLVFKSIGFDETDIYNLTFSWKLLTVFVWVQVGIWLFGAGILGGLVLPALLERKSTECAPFFGGLWVVSMVLYSFVVEFIIRKNVSKEEASGSRAWSPNWVHTFRNYSGGTILGLVFEGCFLSLSFFGIMVFVVMLEDSGVAVPRMRKVLAAYAIIFAYVRYFGGFQKIKESKRD
jgi:hypothetical protein